MNRRLPAPTSAEYLASCLAACARLQKVAESYGALPAGIAADLMAADALLWEIVHDLEPGEEEL